MVCKEDIAVLFKGLEGDERIELMCSLLDCCLPLELRFLGTYIEHSANKYYSNLQRYEKTANNATFGQLRDLHDATIRRKFCIYLALLYSHNKRAATDLFKFLEHFELDNDLRMKDDNLSVNRDGYSDDQTYVNEIKLLFSMGSFHPAFTFQQKEILRNKMRGNADESKLDVGVEDEPKANHSPHSSEEISINQDNKPRDAPVEIKVSSSEGIKKSPQVTKGLNEMGFPEIQSPTLAPVNPSSNPVTRMPLIADSHASQMVEQFQYQPLPIPAIYPQSPSLLGMPFQNVQGIQPPLTVYPTSPRSQVPPNVRAMIVSPSSLPGKPGGVAQGPNGLIHTIYPTQMFGNSVPPPSASVGCSPSEYRFASSPIPVRPTRIYRPLGPGPTNPQQPANYNYNMSPYQSPMDSPIASPFTSPSPSPKSSPLPSPHLSPFPSPAESPMIRRKFPSGCLPARRNSEHYGSVFDWLKSLRLHKYSEVFKDFTFDQMKVLTEADLSRLGLTQGARKKFSLHIDNLVEKGFKGFGNQLGSMENFRSSSSYNNTVDGTVSRTGSTSDLYSMATNTIGLPPGVTHGTAPSSSQSPIFFDQMGNQLSISSSVLNGALMPPPQVDQQSSLDDRNRQNIPHDYALRRGENFIEKSSDDGSQSTCESVEDLTSDDEVFMTRRPTVIENKECSKLQPSCYNCGSKNHFGEQCIEQTMEAETFIRYGYHLDYNSERLKEDRR